MQLGFSNGEKHCTARIESAMLLVEGNRLAVLVLRRESQDKSLDLLL